MRRVILVFWLLWTAGIAGAQNPALTVSERSLDQVLDAAMWDAKQSGPLLVVNPQGTRALPPTEFPAQPVPTT